MPAFEPSGSVSGNETVSLQASAVAIGGRALMIEGPPGSGKSSLALTLIDRGATLIGDDGVVLERRGAKLFACPPPNISGLIEVRGVGLAQRPVAPPTPLALILALGGNTERLPESLPLRTILGTEIPVLAFDPGPIAPAVRAETALALHGIGEV